MSANPSTGKKNNKKKSAEIAWIFRSTVAGIRRQIRRHHGGGNPRVTVSGGLCRS